MLKNMKDAKILKRKMKKHEKMPSRTPAKRPIFDV